jgi:hypothetical protein
MLPRARPNEVGRAASTALILLLILTSRISAGNSAATEVSAAFTVLGTTSAA